MTFFQLMPSTLVAALWSVGKVNNGSKFSLKDRIWKNCLPITAQPQVPKASAGKNHFFSPCSKANLLEDGQGVDYITGRC